MRIAVIDHAGSGDYAEYIFSLVEEKARQNNFQVRIWSNSVPASRQQVAANAIIFISIESNSAFILNWWYKVRIPAILKKIGADLVIDLNGFASGKIRIPQLIAADRFLFKNNGLKQLNKIERFAAENFDHTRQIAENVLVYSKEKINNPAGIEKEKLQAIPFTAPPVFRAYEWHDKIMVKAQHADNKEYFVTVLEDNALNDFVFLLQAFSKFKKWQQSGMQVLILPKYESFTEDIVEKHKTYKFRDDVRLIEDIEEKQTAAIIASAYAFIHIASGSPHLLAISIALQCLLPIISLPDDDVKEYAGNAVLFCSEKSVYALGNTLIQLYKDENLLAQLKEAAQKQAEGLNRQEYEDKLWKLLETAAHS